jgi:nucleotide-binding universal stress UspA family protein
MANQPNRSETIRLPRDRSWLRDRVVVDGGALAIAQGREWADALGVELVVCQRGSGPDAEDGRIVEVPRTFRPARLTARLIVVDATDGHVRWRVRRAASPLLVARERSGTGRIVVAVDCADCAGRLLPLVASWAGKRPAEVTLVHSIEAAVEEAEWIANIGGASESFVPDDADTLRASAKTQLSALLTRYGLRGSVRVGDAPAKEFILDVADEIRPDLLALATAHHRGLLRALRRTVADEVAASAEAPVLVVPHPPHLHAPE